MNQLGGFPLLTLLLAIPLLGALIVVSLRSNKGDTWRWLAILAAVADFFVSLFLYMGWSYDPGGTVQFQDGPWPWISYLGIQHYLAVDGVNAHLVVLTTLVVPLVLLAARPHSATSGRIGSFWTLVLEASTLGALTTRNLVCFTLFWLTALVSAFLLAGVNGYPSGAAVRFVVTIAFTAVLMLACVVGLSVQKLPLDVPDLVASSIAWREQAWLFCGMALAMAAASAVLPFHMWYLDTQCHASPSARTLISAVLLNVGWCGLVRFCLPAFPLAATRFAPVVVLLSTVGLVYAAITALGQRTFPAALAHWDLAQMSLIFMGTFTMQNLGLHGATLLMIGRALATAILLLVSQAHDGEPRAPAPETIGQRGLERIVSVLGILSALAVPGLIGFTGQSTLVFAIVRWHWQPGNSGALAAVSDWLWYALVAFGLLVSAWALFRSWRRSVGPSAYPISQRQALLAVPLVIATLVAGVRPSALSDMIGPTVHRFLGEITSQVETDLRENEPSLPSPRQTPTPASDAGGTARLWSTHAYLLTAKASIAVSQQELVTVYPVSASADRLRSEVPPW